MSSPKVVICPYCGEAQPTSDRCRSCAGLFEPLSRQATHNAMGPWYVRDAARPFQPGCSYEMLVKMIARGQVNRYSIIRGPTTKQFWTVARHAPGVAHLLGYCHNCDASVDAGDHGCHACGVAFGAYLDRNFMGLPEIRPLPWEADLDAEMRAPAGPAHSTRGFEWSRPASHGGLSSFASDDELLGRSAFDHAAAAPTSPAAAPRQAPSFAASPAAGAAVSSSALAATSLPAAASNPAAAEEYSAHSSQRAMQRRLTNQQRTIRMLAIAVGILAIVAVVLIASSMFSGRGESAAPDAAPQTPATDQFSPPSSVDETADDTGVLAPATEAESAASSSPADSDAAAAPGDAGDAAVISAQQADFDRALALSKAADDLARPINDRIADCEQAVRILETLQRDPAAGAQGEPWLEVLPTQLARVQQQLKRLKLEAFFP